MQNTEDAEEITQDVFVKVHGSLASFEGRSGLGTWIYRITINLCKDFIKARSRQKRFGIFTALFHPITNEPVHYTNFDHPGVQLESKEEVEKLFAVINGLPENQKTAILLVRMEGLSQKEVADIMEMSVKGVESLLSRAKENIEKKYPRERRK